MKQNHPVIGINQSGSCNQSKHFSGASEYGARQHFYRSVILAVSGSLFCVAAGERAAAQSSGTAPQASGQMQGEAAQSSPPAIFNGLNMIADNQWPSVPLQPATPPLYSPNATPAAPPTQTTPPTPVTPVTPPPSSTVNVTNSPVAPAVTAPPAASADANSALGLPEMPIARPRVYENEVSGSADFMYGTGTISVPIGYAFEHIAAGFPVGAVSASRSTVYYGGTLSYSYGRNWFLDVSGENGTSTGSTPVTIKGILGDFPASFNVDDTLYQVYLRYNLKNNLLAGTRFGAYLRGGVSLVQATLTTINTGLASGQYGPGGLYREHDNTLDVLGNFGFGLTYSLYSTYRFKAGLQLEGEGFAGNRSQDITERYFPTPAFNASTTINDTVYGAIGRLTFHADYKLGQSGRWKLTGDVGITTKYSFVTYPQSGTQNELLYGPYVKVGLDFLF